MTRKTPLTLEDHLVVGEKLRWVYADLRHCATAYRGLSGGTRGERIVSAIRTAGTGVLLTTHEVCALAVTEGGLGQAELYDAYKTPEARPERGGASSVSFSQHVELGAKLKRVADDLADVYALIANGYTLSRCQPVLRNLRQIRQQVNKARHHAEEQMFKDHPAEATTKVYYGGGHD
jgi:hypothetical protein